MSVNAYKIEEIKTKKDSTFNLWDADWIFDNLDIANQLSEGGGGIVYLQRNDVEFAMKVLASSRLPKESKELNKAILENILNDMDGEDSVEYFCY